MSKIVYLIGDSGTGKSTSIRTLNPEETYLINVCSKDLPFKGSANKYKVKSNNNKGNLYVTNEYSMVIKCIDNISATRPEIKSIVIDDFGYIITHQIFVTAMEKGYDKFVLLAKSVDKILDTIQNSRDDLYVFIIWHTELTENGTYKIKTAGKMIDNQIKPEGKATIVLHTHIIDGKYKFITQNDGIHMAKSPMDMFDDNLIDNDLKFVIDKMNEYYNE